MLQTAGGVTQLPPGDSEHAFTLAVAQPHLWNLDDPFLYRVTAVVTADAIGSHQQDVRCGFRELRIIDGYFHLNGKRIFLKSTHTGNGMPIGQQAPVLPDLVRRDLIYAKAAGFNTVRFIAGVAYPEQLDFCDEIGLLVWESTYAGWCLADSPAMAERFDRSTSAMIRRDRNHPSVAIWELLNETNDGPVFRHAVGFLPALRNLDPTRLVLLSSGRWDGDWTIGSASNPGSVDMGAGLGSRRAERAAARESRCAPQRRLCRQRRRCPLLPTRASDRRGERQDTQPGSRQQTRPAVGVRDRQPV